MLKNKKILPIVVILLIIIIAGIIILCTKGMNYGLSYGNNTTIKIGLDVKQDISDILEEIFGKQYNIKTLSNQENNILITVKSASDEQINTLITKVNEKYSLNINNNDLEISNNPRISGRDLISPYMMPAIIVFILILIYFIIRYKKLGILEILTYTIFTVIGVQLLYLSIYAIVRIPVNQLTMPISMLLFILSSILLIETYEKKVIYIKNSQK